MEVVDVVVAPDFTDLYCPVCGQPIWRRGGNEDQPKCEHVLFLFCDRGGNFTYASPACAEIVAEVQAEYDEDVALDPVQYALWHIDPARNGSILCFSTTACGGPDLSTTWVAIDFEPDRDEGDDGEDEDGDENSADPTKE